MKTLLIIAIVAIIVIVLKACTSSAKMENDLSRPDSSKKPTALKSNDKIILVYNANHNDIKEALTDSVSRQNIKGQIFELDKKYQSE